MTTSLRETILQLFRSTPTGFVSGAQISRTLGVSRTAVWKQIEKLRELGYCIEAVPSKGYRLMQSPDVLLAEELSAGASGQLIGCRIRTLETTDSTNLQAMALGDAGAPEGLVVIADRQTAGKGRLGRSWISPGGVNLYLSVLLRPPVLPAAAPQLTFLSALAVCRTIEDVSDLQPQVKWPNDILLGGRKVAGLLNEMSSETDRVNHVVLGIGINLNVMRAELPTQVRYPATSIAIETGRPVSRLKFTTLLLRRLDELYAAYLVEGGRPLLTAWEAYCELTGQMIEVDCQQRRIHGQMAGIDDDGALLVKTSAGVERILAGDVRPARR
ncbi:MAG TPA: biotin--[acetyl-CoA-carboxylase] ligase [Desulfuromonadales bacterium]|nr:biotin--[acetyl-CoA-carboxylase] ligase [Desulfuromonadales bacterium]